MVSLPMHTDVQNRYGILMQEEDSLEKYVCAFLSTGTKHNKTNTQECIKPIKIEKSPSSTGAKIKIQDDGSYISLSEKGEIQKLARVDISLNDCLACSGCITTAETVLITQQSHDEMLRVIKENNNLKQNNEKSKLIVVSVSIQPVLSLAALFNLPPEETYGKLSGYLKKLGVDMVLDMSVADNIALLEAQNEFIERYRVKQSNNKPVLPIFTSACPGWICYAEKTHGEFILPYVSEVKSPQQIIGALVKDYIAQLKCWSPKDIYHITIMPCYDKKLEASRTDFYNQQLETKDVDCVITAIELEMLLENEGVNLCEVESASIDWPWNISKMDSYSSLQVPIGSTSGGYAAHIYKYAAKEIFSKDIVELTYKQTRNQDLKELIFEEDGIPVMKFAIANGFRNIQNIVQKLKRGKCQYDYVEIMACPSGCINGGAQIRPKNGESPKELVHKLESLYDELPQGGHETKDLVKHLYTDWLHGQFSDKARSLLHTSYHAVPKNTIALNIKW